jgi:hypothetical protein
MSVGKARKEDLSRSVEAKATKVVKDSEEEAAMSVGKASKDEEPAMSVSSAKTAKVTDMSVAVE